MKHMKLIFLKTSFEFIVLFLFLTLFLTLHTLQQPVSGLGFAQCECTLRQFEKGELCILICSLRYPGKQTNCRIMKADKTVA